MKKQLGENLNIDDETLVKIKGLDNWDLLMLLSEIDDHGWEVAKETLRMILDIYKKRPSQN